MKDPRPLGETLGQGRSDLEIAQAVAAAWDELAEVASDGQMKHVMHLEEQFSHVGAGELVWLAYLKRAARYPLKIGHDPPSYECRCLDTGWVLAFCTCGRIDCVAYRPCELCNRGAWLLWRDGHYAPGHRCNVCMGKKRAPQESAREVVREERAEDDAKAIEEELF